MIFVEACAGTAALSFALCGAKPPVPMAGSKRSLAAQLLVLMDLADLDAAGKKLVIREVPERVVLIDPGEWGRTLGVMFSEKAQGFAKIGDVIESWIPRNELELFDELRLSAPSKDPATRAATHLYLQTRTYRGKPVYPQAAEVQKATGVGWKTHGFDKEYRAAKKKASGSKDRGFFNARPALTKKLRELSAISWPEVVVHHSDAATALPQVLAEISRPPEDVVLFVDPPYVGTTPYGVDLTREEVLFLARGAKFWCDRIYISEAEALKPLIDDYSFKSAILKTRENPGTQLGVHTEYVTYYNEKEVAEVQKAVIPDSVIPDSAAAIPETLIPSNQEPAMRFITDVEANFKGGVKRKLAQRTLIVGDNAAGKSAIIQAAEYALEHGASDIAGRAWSVDGVPQLAPQGEKPEAIVRLSDGSFKKSSDKDHGGRVLRLREMREELTGSDERAARYMLRLITGDTPEAAVRAALGKSEKALILKLGDTAIDALLRLREISAKSARDLEKEAKILESANADAGNGAAAPPTAEEITELEAALAVARAAASMARGVNAASVKAKELAVLQEEVAALLAQNAAVPAPDVAAATRKRRNAKAIAIVARLVLEKKPHSCVICTGPLDVAALKDHVEAVEKRAAEIDAESAASPDAKARESLQLKIGSIQARIAAIEADAKNAGDAKEAAKAVIITTAAEKAAEHALQERLVARGVAEKLSSFAAKITTARASAAEAKIVAEAAENACKSLVEKAIVAYIKRVQALLPKGWVFGLQLEPFRFGLHRKDASEKSRFDTALSGAEWVSVLLAMAAASVPAAAEGPVVLIPEERAWDPGTLAKVMRALAAVPCQILLTSTVAPKGWRKNDDSWLILDLDAEAADEKTASSSTGSTGSAGSGDGADSADGGDDGITAAGGASATSSPAAESGPQLDFDL